MSGKKKSFSFRLPWLPSLVSAPFPPGHSSSSKRNRKTAPPFPTNADSAGMTTITIHRETEQLEGETPAQVTQHLAQQESQTPLPKTDVQSGQSTSENLKAASREEPAQFHIHLSGTDTETNQMQFSNISSAEEQAPPDEATQSQSIESQQILKTESHSPPALITQQPSPAKESKPCSPSGRSKLIKSESHSPSASATLQKPSPTPSNSQQRSPSHTGTISQANSKPSPASNEGNRARSITKQPSPVRAVTHPQTTSLPPVPSRTVKSVKTSSKSSSTSLSLPSSKSSSSSSLSSPKSSSSSPPYSPSSQSSSSLSYLTGESSNSSNKHLTSSPTTKNSPNAQTSKPKTHASQVYHERKSTLPREETTQPDATKSTQLEAIQANESNTPVTVYDKMTPEPSHALEMKEVIAIRLTEHPSTEEVSHTEEDKSHSSARRKGKRKLFLKRVSPHGSRLMPQDTHKGDGPISIPLQNEIKNDVSKIIEMLSSGKGQSESGDQSVSIITISGDNKGATLHLNGKAQNLENHMTATNSDSDEHQARMACINSNIQTINNSMLLSSSVHERNPGVHFGSLSKHDKSAKPKMKEISSSSKASGKQKSTYNVSKEKL